MTDTPRETQGYWWCGNCREEANPRHVTHAELHENCGHPVAWIDPVGADLVKQLRAELDAAKKRIEKLEVQTSKDWNKP